MISASTVRLTATARVPQTVTHFITFSAYACWGGINIEKGILAKVRPEGQARGGRI